MLFSRKTDTNVSTTFAIEFTEEEMRDCAGMDGLAELNSDNWYPGSEPGSGISMAPCIIRMNTALRLLADMTERLMEIEDERARMTPEERTADLMRRAAYWNKR